MEAERSSGVIRDLNEDGHVETKSAEVFTGTAIEITVEKLGLKDASQGYINSHFTITVADSDGEPVEEPINTPFSTMPRDPQHINFEHSVTFKSPKEFLEQIPRVAIYFEFKHEKPKSDYVSTKCFSIMEFDELQDGPVVLEVLKCDKEGTFGGHKTVDFSKRSGFQRLSVKDLHLHLRVQLTHKSDYKPK